jgi:hypothetical protein
VEWVGSGRAMTIVFTAIQQRAVLDFYILPGDYSG